MSCYTADKRIFISYRRSDSLGYAGGLEYALETVYKPENVFRDVADIGGGVDFSAVIKSEINHAHLAIILISEDWATLAGKDGGPRLFDSKDWVRREVELILRRTIPILPVLIEDARMPVPEALPDTLQRLPMLNGMQLRDRQWRQDVDRVLSQVAVGLAPKKLAGASIYDHVRSASDPPKWVGRQYGLEGPPFVKDLGSGGWRTVEYQIRMQGPKPSPTNWFLATEFADAVTAAGAKGLDVGSD
jgi:hypothetical protein